MTISLPLNHNNPAYSYIDLTRYTMTPEQFRTTTTALKNEIQKIIVGQEAVIDFILTAMLAGGHSLLEGVPGLGKTLLIRTLGRIFQLQFKRIQFVPDLMPADITGTMILDQVGNERALRFEPGPIFANLILADEINRASPKTQAALLEAMQERTVTVGQTTYALPQPFFVLATQNPLEMEGTYPLPEAQLDRFLFKIEVPFPSADELTTILMRTTGRDEQTLKPILDGGEMLALQQLVKQVPIPSNVMAHISQIIVETHPKHSSTPLVKQYVRYGSSPRGGQALALGAKVQALLQGRYNVSFEDVARVAEVSLRHRLILNFEAQAQGISADEIIETLPLKEKA